MIRRSKELITRWRTQKIQRAIKKLQRRMEKRNSAGKKNN